MNDADQSDHWLVRPGTIRLIWIWSCTVLALTVVAQLFLDVKGFFGVDGWVGFGALFGFGSCVAMVIAAKALGWILKRDERYYDD